jgi:hypothetical protein
MVYSMLVIVHSINARLATLKSAHGAGDEIEIGECRVADTFEKALQA